MISFNTILRSEQIDPVHVKLVRHQDTRLAGRPTPYQLWKANDGRFELYQKIQGEPKFVDAQLIASFVTTPLGETLFVGLFAVNGIGKAAAGLIDPISNEDVGGFWLYDLTPLEKLKDYQGKLVVDWGKGYRSWVQWAGNQDKNVVEIRRVENEPPFPGLLEFRRRLSEFASIPVAWREVLSSVGGVYLLVCPTSGMQYVGSASGATGFWGRWLDYAASGHGGNQRMKGIPDSDYQVTILEVASSSAGLDELFKKESNWKAKLLSQKLGLNAN